MSLIPQLSYANTFGDWLSTTIQLVTQNNNFYANNYTKPTGTLFLGDTTLGLQVNSAAIIAGSFQVAGAGSNAYIQNDLQIGGNTSVGGSLTAGSLQVSGNFVISGTTQYSANIFTLSSNALVNANGAYEVHRPTGANAVILWNEVNTVWELNDVTNGNYYRILTDEYTSSSYTSNATNIVATSDAVFSLYNYTNGEITNVTTFANAAFTKANTGGYFSGDINTNGVGRFGSLFANTNIQATGNVTVGGAFFGNGSGLVGTASALNIGGTAAHATQADNANTATHATQADNANTATQATNATNVNGGNVSAIGITVVNQNNGGLISALSSNGVSTGLISVGFDDYVNIYNQNTIGGVAGGGGTLRILTNTSPYQVWSIDQIGNVVQHGSLNVANVTSTLFSVNNTYQQGLTVVGTNTSWGGGILLNDSSGQSSVAPNKWIRSYTNQLQFVNNAYSAVLGYFDDSGNLTASGNITAYSDARLKTNVKTIENALEIVKKLRGTTFDKDGRRSLGVIAQEVQKIVPEAVHVGTDEKQMLSVAYGNMVGLLIEAIKELEQEVAELKKSK